MKALIRAAPRTVREVVVRVPALAAWVGAGGCDAAGAEAVALTALAVPEATGTLGLVLLLELAYVLADSAADLHSL